MRAHALDRLSDDELLERLVDLVRCGRTLEVEIVRHIAEMDTRKLYLREACSSMFGYATERLHLSEAEAYLRISVARVSRRFPLALAMLEDGRLHLSAIARLAPHLEVHGEPLLVRAVHRSRRELDVLVAELAPQPDAPAQMRRLPVATIALASASAGELERCGGVPLNQGAGELRPDGAAAPTEAPTPRVAPAPPPRILAPGRYKVQFTANESLHEKITRAQALLAHQIPDGDLAQVFDRAMTLLVAALEKAKFGATEAPRSSVETVDTSARSRHIPAAVRRVVSERDGHQCAFVDTRGRRCSSRRKLEFHHRNPFGQGGDHDPAHLELRCRPHNVYEAELDYGTEHMDACRQRRGSPSTAKEPGPLWILDRPNEQRA